MVENVPEPVEIAPEAPVTIEAEQEQAAHQEQAATGGALPMVLGPDGVPVSMEE